MRIAIRLSWLNLLLLAALATGASAATVERFSPQGEIRSVRQVAVRFSEDMVKFGDAQAPTPFAIDCAEAGQGRWLDARSWVFDFSRDLPPGLRCTFKVKPEAKAFAGSAVSGKTEFAFSTGGPAVLSSQPYSGGNVDEEQVFILRLNGAVHEPSVLANAWCVAEGIGERIPVAITGGQARADFFKALKREKEANDAKLLLLKCQQRLPPGAKLTLVWGKGIAMAGATEAQRVATSQDQPLKFQVRPEFKISFSCARENANAPCSPYQPMQLVFSSPVTRTMADAIRIKSSQGEHKPFWNQDNREAIVNRLTFNGPFPESAELSIQLPPKFADDSGRPPVNASSFPLKTRTGEGPPLAKFAANFGIIELAQPVLPVTLRNVEPQLRQYSARVLAGDAAAPNTAHVLLANSDMQTAQICTSVVVVCELLVGLRRRTHPRWAVRYDDVMANLDVKPLDAAAATHYADLRTRLEQAGTPIGPNDALIAAHALALGATLVSADPEFKRVPGLKLENWLQ